MAKHPDEVGPYLHVVHNWTYADSTSREAAGGFTSDDLLKIAYQEDDESFWFLTATTPTWKSLGSLTLADIDAGLTKALFGRHTAKTSAYTAVLDDRGTCFETSGTWTLALDPAVDLGVGYAIAVFHAGTGTLTIDPDGSETIRDATSSATTKTLTQGEAAIIMGNGTGFLMMKISVGGTGLTNPMTTEGDLIVGGASGTADRLAAGSTSGHVLTSNGAGVAPSWQAPSGGGGTFDIRFAMGFN